ncbi:MAG TPA: tetratricopeptide repeat protein [Candidatus Methylacidiphilales bacterium]|jgi:tetratricopeptide (TPR) repeat protein|nr:tetratricopeptide repeat protein [Candidatus Methylacidiphilales bacterium]
MAAKSKAKPRGESDTGPQLFADLPPASRQKFLVALQAVTIVLGAFAVFSPVLRDTWYGDDALYITGNPLLRMPGRLAKAWLEPGSFIDYYPLEQTVQYLQWCLFGQDSPFYYLLCNLALHAASALLLWRLFARLGLRYAWLGGLLFAIHPLLVDSVGNATELKNTLSLPPLLLALCAWLDFDRTRAPRDYALGLYLVSMLCKITAYFLPIVLLLYAWWKRGKITWADCRAAAPFFAVSLALSLLQIHAGAVYAGATHYVSPGPIHLGGLGERLELAGLSLAFYFGHAVLPVPIMPYYPQWPLDPLSPLGFLPWIGIALVLAACWIRRRAWGRPVLFALAFFLLGLAPFLGFNQVSYMCLYWVSDHLLYLPIIALIGLAVAGVEGLAAQIPARLHTMGAGLLALIVLLLGAQTHSYATLFAGQEQLWRDNLRHNPGSWMLHDLLGTELATQQQLPEAIAELRESLRLNPRFDNAEMTLGLCLFKTGDFKGAIAAFRRCLELNPRYHAAQLFLGFVLARDGQLDAAIAQFRAFLRGLPTSAQAHMGLGQTLAMQGHIPEAIAELQTALQLDPTNQEIPAQIAALQSRETAPPK